MTTEKQTTPLLYYVLFNLVFSNTVKRNGENHVSLKSYTPTNKITKWILINSRILLTLLLPREEY